MPRLPEILERDALPEDKREAFDYLLKTRGGVRLPFSPLLHSPDVTQRVAHVGTYIRFESALPAKDRELAAFSDERALPVRFARALLIDHRVPDATFEAVRRRYGDQGVIDLAATVGYYAMIGALFNALAIEPSPEAPKLP